LPELYRRQGASLASKLVPAANRHLDQRICDVCDRVSRRFRAALIEGVPDGFAVFSGDDATALELMRRGGQGNVSVTANIAARDMAAMCHFALTGEWEAAAEIDARLSELNDLLLIEANPIPVKWAMAQRGMMEYGIRLPLTPLSEPCRGDLERALETYFA